MSDVPGLAETDARRGYRFLADENGKYDMKPFLSEQPDIAADNGFEADRSELAGMTDDAPKWTKKEWKTKLAEKSTARLLRTIFKADVNSRGTKSEATRARERQEWQARSAWVQTAQRQVGPLPLIPKLEYPAVLNAQEWNDGRNLLEKAASGGPAYAQSSMRCRKHSGPAQQTTQSSMAFRCRRPILSSADNLAEERRVVAAQEQ